MEEKVTNKKIIVDAIMTSLISSLVLLIINLGGYWFTKEKINITVTPSSYINNEYVTVISIKNFQNNKSNYRSKHIAKQKCCYKPCLLRSIHSNI